MSAKPSPARITCINDSEDFLNVMREFLGGELGHQVICLTAVDTSIDQVLDTRPDLIMLDLVLEDRAEELSGWELLVLSRAHRDLRHVPVIIASADTHGMLKQRADELASMANVHILPKPFSLDDLEPLVGRLLTP
jgi:CheY-like chemotaxis protein